MSSTVDTLIAFFKAEIAFFKSQQRKPASVEGKPCFCCFFCQALNVCTGFNRLQCSVCASLSQWWLTMTVKDFLMSYVRKQKEVKRKIWLYEVNIVKCCFHACMKLQCCRCWHRHWRGIIVVKTDSDDYVLRFPSVHESPHHSQPQPRQSIFRV